MEGLPGTFTSREEAVEAVRSHYPDYMCNIDEDGYIVMDSWSSVLPAGVKPNTYAKVLALAGVKMNAGTRRRMQRYTKREMVQAATAAQALCRRLGLPVTFLFDASSIPDTESNKRRRRAKGWYDPQTGRITIIVGNHNSVADIIATVLHEGVAHHGLREMFGEDFDTFLSNVYLNASADVRRRISESAMRKYDNDFRRATEEYLANLAESTDFDSDANRAWWAKIKDLFIEMLRKAGVMLNSRLTDEDLRYILWRSYHRLEQQGAMGVAEDIVMRDKFAEAEASTTAAAEPVRAVARNTDGRSSGGQMVREANGGTATTAKPALQLAIPGATDVVGIDVVTMDDADLLEAISNDGPLVSSDYTDEYDKRHTKEYNEVYDSVRTMLDDDATSIDDAEEMLRNAASEWKDGYNTERRTDLKARFEAVDDYLADKEAEREWREEFIEDSGEGAWEEEEDQKRKNQEFLFRDDDTTDEEPEEEYDAGGYTVVESLIGGLLTAAASANAALETRETAIRSLGVSLSKLRQAMARQREYDRTTVDAIVRLAKKTMDSGFFKGMTRTEVKRLINLINKAAGREDITRQADAVVDMLLNHQLNECAAMLKK